MAPGISRSRVLVADDEESIRDGVQQVLSRQGYEVVTAENGRQALALLEREEFQVLLLDLRMPDLEGMEVLRRVKESGWDVDVIIITGHGTIETAVSAIKMGALDFITKPFAPWLLKQVVGRALGHRRLKEERDRLAVEAERGLGVIATESSRLKTVINSMSEGVLITDQDQNVVLCNPAFTGLMRIPYKCTIGAPLGEISQLAVLGEIAAKLDSGLDEVQALTQEISVPGEPELSLRANVNRVTDDAGRTLGLVTVLEDITPFKEMDQQKSAFVAMLAHELKAPLGVVFTQINVVLRGLAGKLSEKQTELFNRMRDRVGGVGEMIDDLLHLAQAENKSFVQAKEMVDINPLVTEACEIMEVKARESELDLTMELDAGIPRVLADPKSVREVVVNLLSNAVRYTPGGGNITVATGSQEGYVFIAVADTGIGIAPKDQDRVFDRFFRVKSEKTRDIVGTGLGLPIVKAIMEDHRGRVLVESEPGQGSTFKALFPITV
ncbi:MAG: response regulator [Desulfarculaceae bacterium]|jgi:signal transduction histidine kinase/FixJ family two-component response regulator